MALVEATYGAKMTDRWREVMKGAATVSIVSFGLACAFLAVNASSSHAFLIIGAEVVASVALAAGLLSLASGIS